jgi:hypothetical protein
MTTSCLRLEGFRDGYEIMNFYGRDGDVHVFMRFGFGGTLSRFEHLEKHPSQVYILEKFSCFFGVL